ncbi:MAG: lactate utilization protein B [Sphingomonadales bacterium]
MKNTPGNFKASANAAMANPELQKALMKFQAGFPYLKKRAMATLSDPEALRTKAAARKDYALNNLAALTKQFETRVKANGGEFHFCKTAEEARNKVTEICKSVGAKKITKSKSMVTEEIFLNVALEKEGFEVLETDLGEYIIQLAGERPSHIVGPALHKTKREVAELFTKHHGLERPNEAGETLVKEARQVLREQYFQSDVGITGANFLVAETGTVAIVTNEGNADLCRVLPKTNIVVTSMEKVIPSLNDLSLFLRLLGRSASGQEMTSYTTLLSGPRGDDEDEGPSSFHVIVLDGGRSKLLGTENQDILRCIKCGACMNACPVYMSVGGHAYGWVYPGPIGAAINPVLNGMKEMVHNYQASTFCGACEVACPVKIPLTKIFRNWREVAFEKGYSSTYSVKVWGFLASRPGLYRFVMGLAIPLVRGLAGKKGYLKSLPFFGGWFKGRTLSAPEGKRFVKGGRS